jgi:hypothetical protein
VAGVDRASQRSFRPLTTSNAKPCWPRGPSLRDQARHAAVYVDKILKRGQSGRAACRATPRVPPRGQLARRQRARNQDSAVAAAACGRSDSVEAMSASLSISPAMRMTGSGRNCEFAAMPVSCRFQQKPDFFSGRFGRAWATAGVGQKRSHCLNRRKRSLHHRSPISTAARPRLTRPTLSESG